MTNVIVVAPTKVPLIKRAARRALIERAVRRAAKDLAGDDCHAIEGAWILRVNGTAEDVYAKLISSPNLPSDQPLLVSELKGTWKARHASSEDDCFRL